MDRGFAKFLKKKRKSLGISQRIFADSVEISYSYISSLESGKRPAPSRDILIRMENGLRLNPEDKEMFELLAAKTRSKPTVSYEIAEYINKNKSVYNAVSLAQKNNIGEDVWQEFLDKIKMKYL